MKKIISLLGIVFILNSCAKEDASIDKNSNSQKVATFKDYMTFLNANTKGQVLIQSVSSLESKNNLYNMSSLIKGDNLEPIALSLDNNTFKLDNISKTGRSSTATSSSLDLSSLFGKKMSLELKNNSLTARESSITAKPSANTTEVYIPTLLKSKVSSLVNGKVVPGTKISWNADPQNTNGVILTMEYKPLIQSDASVVEKFPKSIVGGLTMEDTGNYTITSSDLSAFPDNSNISFFIGRVGYTIVNDKTSNDDVSIGGITSVITDFHIKK